MSEFIKHSTPPASASHEETNVVVLIKKMQQHLMYLEKKIDMLIQNQSSSRPAFNSNNSRPRNFSRPPRPGFGHSQDKPRHSRPFDRDKKPFFKRHRDA